MAVDNSDSFVHLHTHSDFSVRDSIARLNDLCVAAMLDEQPALAITDHGNLGASRLLRDAAEHNGIKPIYGVEAYLAIEDGEPNARLRQNTVTRDKADDEDDTVSADNEGEKEKKYNHLTILAETPEGWSNLLRIQAEANDAFWSKPRADLDLLQEHHEGLIVLTGCLGGPIKEPLAHGDVEGARKNLGRLVDIFGKTNVFIEVMSHGIPQEDRLNGQLEKFAKEFGLRSVATNDSHYVHESDEHAHDAWLCVSSNSTLDNPNRWKFSGSGFHLRSAAEMRELFTLDQCDLTLEIAERCTQYDMMPKHGLRLPTYDPSDERDSDRILYEMTRDAAPKRYGSPLPAVVKERLRYELDIIANAHLSDYFLIVADMIHWAKAQGIRVGPGRGSAAGSCVSYSLGITNIDPIKHGLLFERFLNPTRVKMPDIDSDFEQNRREEVITYLAQRWGDDRVARIGTHGTSMAKNSLRAAGKVLSEGGMANKLASMVPTMTGGRTASMKELVSGSASHEFKEMAEGAPRVIEIATAFEGIVNTEGIHACGVVVSDESLLGLVPLRRDRKTNSRVTEWDGTEIEDANFLKMDVLGLTALDIIQSTARLAGIDPDEIDFEDEKAWDLIAKGHTSGLFQLESTGMTDLARRINARSVDDLGAVIALYRPGPLGIGMHIMYADRKAGTAPVDYGIFSNDEAEVEIIKSILGETYGVITYQEQILRLADVVAGFGPPERSNLLTAIGKKIREQMDLSGELFLKMAVQNVDHAGESKMAFSTLTANKLWDSFKSAGDYLFNKSHAVGYAYVTYQMAWLKANYPAEFAAGWLSHTDDADKRATFLANLEGVPLACPDVNHSLATPSVHEGSVTLGLGGISDVGSVADAIVSERLANGPFTSLHNLASRVKIDDKRISVTALNALVDCGACDAFGPRLGQVMMMGTVKDVDAPVPDFEFDVLERSARERQRLGILVSENPLRVLRGQLKLWKPPSGRSVTPVHKLAAGNVSTLGIVASFEIIKKRSRFVKMRLAGTNATISCLIWERTLSLIEKGEGVPRIGDVIGVDGLVKTSVKVFDEDEETDEDETLEMTVNDIWRGPLVPPRWGEEARPLTTEQDEADFEESEPEVILEVEIEPSDVVEFDFTAEDAFQASEGLNPEDQAPVIDSGDSEPSVVEEPAEAQEEAYSPLESPIWDEDDEEWGSFGKRTTAKGSKPLVEVTETPQAEKRTVKVKTESAPKSPTQNGSKPSQPKTRSTRFIKPFTQAQNQD